MSGVREAMIVAGGAGTRLWPLTATTPKPLLPFCGAPFLSGVIRRLADVGVGRVLLVVGAATAPFEVLRADAAAAGVELATVPEPEPLDTAGGVRAALDRVSGSFLVLNGDILTDLDLRALIDAHTSAGAAATLALTRVEDTSAYGVCVLDGTRVVGFVEKPSPGDLPGQDAINAGSYVLEPDAMAGFPSGRLSFEQTVFPQLVEDGAHVEGVVSDAVWADLGTPERYLTGHRLALDGALRWPALAAVPQREAGVYIDPSARVASDVTLHAPVLVSADTRVGGGAQIGPHSVLGEGVELGADALVSRSVLGPGTRIGAGARVEGLVTGSRSVVGDGAMVWGPVTIGDDHELSVGERATPGTTVPQRS